MNNHIAAYFNRDDIQYTPTKDTIIGGVETNNELFDEFMRYGGEILVISDQDKTGGDYEDSEDNLDISPFVDNVDINNLIVAPNTQEISDDISDDNSDDIFDILGGDDDEEYPSRRVSTYRLELDQFIEESGIFDP